MMDIKEQIADYGVNNDAPGLTAERNSNGVNLPTSMEEQINKPIQNTYESEISISPKKRKEDYIDSEDFKAKPVYEFFKRFFDIVLSALASVVLLIPILVIAVIIMYKDSGNPFYLHTRVGRHHKQIKILKFRSMRIGADSLEDMLTQEDLEEYKREYKIRDDPRLIGWEKPGDGNKCFGAKLRQLSLDELLQIPYNILIKNDLSLVGPRPILESELLENYTPEQQEMLLSVKPGLTGYWQAYARNDATYADGKRQQMELWYVQNRSFWLDIKIIFATVAAVLEKSGV